MISPTIVGNDLKTTTTMSKIPLDWSKLCPDLLRSILEGLTSKDYHRARTVCSNWYSVSTTCKRPVHPWRILVNYKNSTLSLINPEEDNKTLQVSHPDTNVNDKSYAMASCSNWLLMFDGSQSFYLLNVFTRERIDLPPMHPSLFGLGEDDGLCLHRSDIESSRQTAVLWINERTRDFFVAWCYGLDTLFTHKNGDVSWKSLEDIRCFYITYHDQKLYVYTVDHYIKILDLSGDSFDEIVEGNPYRGHRFDSAVKKGEYIWKRRVAVSNSGEVFIVVSVKGLEGKSFFEVVKMNLESGKWEKVASLGGEMVMFGHGVTLRAPVKDIGGWGMKGDSVCFFEDDLWHDDSLDYYSQVKCGVYDLATSTIVWAKQAGGMIGDKRMETRWFVPGYA